MRRDHSPDTGNRFKSTVAIIIGIVSVTGAFATWRSVILGNEADDADRRVIIETVIKERANVRVQTQLNAERQYFARYRANLVQADELEAAADAARARNQQEDAQRLQDEAEALREVADALAFLTFRTAYVTGEGADIQFDAEKRADDLAREDIEATQVDPDQTARLANGLHARSLRFIQYIVGFIGVIFLLTMAQLGRVEIRPFIAGAATVLFVVLAVLAFTGDKA